MRHILLGLGVAFTLSACGDPLRDIARFSDVNAVPNAANVTQTPVESRNTGGGLFSRLLNRPAQDPTNAAVEAALADTGAAAAEPQIATPAAQPQSQTDRGGLFGMFDGMRRPNASGARSGIDAPDVPAGSVMPFGQIGRVCDLNGRTLGRQIESDAGFEIFDTIPNTTAARPFYITGFNDNCARTFTGAVVVTGDVETHEFVRYRPSNERIAYTETDNAYEALKASECRVGRGQPCGANTERLSRNTHFVTIYNFFGGTFSAVPTEWAQILVHDGQVLAISIKDGR